MVTPMKLITLISSRHQGWMWTQQRNMNRFWKMTCGRSTAWQSWESEGDYLWRVVHATTQSQRAKASSLWMSVHPYFNSLQHILTWCTLTTPSSITSNNCWWISIGEACFSHTTPPHTHTQYELLHRTQVSKCHHLHKLTLWAACDWFTNSCTISYMLSLVELSPATKKI